MPITLSNTVSLASLEQQSNAKLVSFLDWTSFENIQPTQGFPVITNEFPQIIQFFQWGLVPVWAKTPLMGKNMFRTKWDNLQEKTALQAIYDYKRCIIPVNGYTIKKEDQSISTFQLSNHLVFLAGLWSVWGEGLQSFSVITYFDKTLQFNTPFMINSTIKEKWLSKNNISLSFLKSQIH